jgi:D-glycero-D-manno-heptose 1,7-bisphosphate phosphatase
MGINKITRPAIFLDRDGVLNPTVFNPHTGRMESPLSPRDFCLIDGVLPALKRLQCAGYLLILVSNQPNYALGKSSYDTHRLIQHKLETQLDAAGIHFTRFCYCLHHPKGLTPGYSHVCDCRKPSPGLLFQACDDFSLTLRDSWMIGDQPTDTQCGRAAGVRTIRIAEVSSGVRATPQSADPCADYFAGNLADAARIILSDRVCSNLAGFCGDHEAGVDLVCRP